MSVLYPIFAMSHFRVGYVSFPMKVTYVFVMSNVFSVPLWIGPAFFSCLLHHRGAAASA